MREASFSKESRPKIRLGVKGLLDEPYAIAKYKASKNEL